ncbi:MAG: translation initiation factor IF-3 [Actinobacteria bacterium]|nr:translation initiation factor IF-3 [Actinomycetota bacterium]MBI3256183.1 translation initiation factor IF-3 [Actinomycetota bacterium]
MSMGPAKPRRCPIATPANNEPRINDRIRAREVRLVSAEGEQVGVTPLAEALNIAREQDLDLVEVAPQANPPVCRIMDYGKYKYEAAQKAKESRRKSTQVAIKEMKYRVKIGKGDFDTKTHKIVGFLEEGHKVKVTIMFRGREVHHPELGMKILDNVAAQTTHLAKIEATPRLDGRNMTMVLAPDKRVQAAWEAAQRKAKSEEAAAELQDGASPESGIQVAPAAGEPVEVDAPVTSEAPVTSASETIEPSDGALVAIVPEGQPETNDMQE